MKVQTRGRAGVWLLCLVLPSWGVGSAATWVLNPVDTVGDGLVAASRTTAAGGGFSVTNPNPTATPSPSPPPSDPLVYPVPRSPVTITFFNYGAPVARNPALICLGAAENDFWEHAAGGPGGKLDRAVGQTLEYRFRRVHLTVVPVGEVRGLRWRSIRPMVLGLRYFVDTYGAMDMLFDIRVEGMGTGRVGTGRLTTV